MSARYSSMVPSNTELINYHESGQVIKEITYQYKACALATCYNSAEYMFFLSRWENKYWESRHTISLHKWEIMPPSAQRTRLLSIE
jgi:hypothetical protein